MIESNVHSNVTQLVIYYADILYVVPAATASQRHVLVFWICARADIPKWAGTGA